MPEGDTVWLASKRMHDALAGRELTRFDLRVPRHATADLTGRRVTEVIARGKHMLTRVEGGLTLHTHFRMDGTWHLQRPGARWRGGPAYQVRAVLANTDWEAVGYRLHDVLLLSTDDEDQVVGHLGPDVLGPDWDPAEAARRLAAEPDRQVGDALPDQRMLAGEAMSSVTLAAATADGFWVENEAVRRLCRDPEQPVGQALLDQRNIAGLGTVYRAETLFIRGVNPWTAVRDLADPGGLLRLARRLMIANREHPGQVTTGDRRRGREHWVYGRAGQPCRRCGSAVRRGSQGPHTEERVIYWCPTCQPSTSG